MDCSTFATATRGLEAFSIEIKFLSRPAPEGRDLHPLPAATWERLKLILGARFPDDSTGPPVVYYSGSLPEAAAMDFDLAVAAGLLLGGNKKKFPGLESCCWAGELGPGGEILPVKSVLSRAMEARKKGFRRMLVPAANAREAALVNNLTVIGLADLQELQRFLDNPESFQPLKVNTREEFFDAVAEPVLGKVRVPEDPLLRRALEIAATGGQSLLLVGSSLQLPPLGEFLQSLLPPLDLHEALESTRIYSAAGLLGEHRGLVSTRSIRSPRYSAEPGQLLGTELPGELALADQGLLLTQQLPEFSSAALQAISAALATGRITTAFPPAVEYPAKFQLLASMSPCPCGHFRQPGKQCTCSPAEICQYRNRVPATLWQQIDLQLELFPPAAGNRAFSEPEPLQVIRERVSRARQFRDQRIKAAGGEKKDAATALDPVGRNWLQALLKKQKLPAAAAAALLRIARSIADLEAAIMIRPEMLTEATLYHGLPETE